MPIQDKSPSESIPPIETQKTSPETLLFDLSTFDQEKVKMAEELGIPLNAIADTMNAWSASVEKRFDILAAGVAKSPERTIQLLQEMNQRARAEYEKTHQNQQQQQSTGEGGEIGLIKQLGGLLGSGGGEEDEFQKEFKKRMYDSAFSAMDSDRAMGKAIKDHVVASLAQNVAKKIAEEVVSKV
jgi:hypothetical protein